jgi:hypothetical protein
MHPIFFGWYSQMSGIPDDFVYMGTQCKDCGMPKVRSRMYPTLTIPSPVCCSKCRQQLEGRHKAVYLQENNPVCADCVQSSIPYEYLKTR